MTDDTRPLPMPATIFGQRLLGQIAYHEYPEGYLPGDMPSWWRDAAEDILAIEAEATRAERERIAAAVEAMWLGTEVVAVNDAVFASPMVEARQARAAVLALLKGADRG